MNPLREYLAFQEKVIDLPQIERDKAIKRRHHYVDLVTMQIAPEKYPSGAYEKRTSFEVLCDTFIWPKVFLVLSRKPSPKL